MKAHLAIFAGSFDPLTYGHLDLIERATRLFDHLVVLIAVNRSKNGWLPLSDRRDLVTRSVAHLRGVEVDVWEGLTADYAVRRGATVTIRGVRSGADLEWERTVSWANQSQGLTCETCLLLADPRWQNISSSLVREIYMLGGDVKTMVPQVVWEYLQDRGGKA